MLQPVPTLQRELICVLRRFLTYLYRVLVFDLACELLVQQLLAYGMLCPLIIVFIEIKLTIATCYNDTSNKLPSQDSTALYNRTQIFGTQAFKSTK